MPSTAAVARSLESYSIPGVLPLPGTLVYRDPTAPAGATRNAKTLYYLA